jgi:hypothetical protein
LARGYFVVRAGGDYVASDLAARVYRVALKSCSPETLNKIRETRKRYSPLLWVGIRVGNRTWANQIDGLSKVINALHRKYPRLGVVFDGFSLPADRSSQSAAHGEYSAIIDEENGIVNSVIQGLQQHSGGACGIVNIIGSSIFDANVWAHFIDVYLSPYGTVQHKVGWLTNKPGIIHTNRKLLEGSAKYVWAAIENAVKPRYVKRTCVEDVRGMQREAVIYNEISEANESGAGIQALNKRARGNPEFNNYIVEWEELYKDLLDLIRTPKITLRLAPSLLVNASKRRLKEALQGVTNMLDSSRI